VGDTLLEVEPSTLPTLLLMLKVVGAPPDKVHARVEDPPDVIEEGVAVKELITGAVTGAGVVIVTEALMVGEGETTET
jgi:hypothetical protein